MSSTNSCKLEEWKPKCRETFKNHAFPLFFLLLFTSLTYCEVLTHTFLVSWDDPGYITQNPAIRGITLHNLKLAFSNQYVANYAPVQIVSYMIDYMVWGLRPFGFLLANVVYHFISGILLYFLFMRLGFWKWGALFGSLVFVVHPVQMESVAWMSQRKNLLAMMFFLLAFHSWLSYRAQTDKRAWKSYTVTFIFSLLSLLSKSVAIIFPLMLILYDTLFPASNGHIKRHLDKIPFLISAAVVGIVTTLIQNPDVAGGRVEYPENVFIVLPMTMLPVLVAYLRMLMWPVPSSLSAIYSIPTRYHIDSEVLFALVIAVCLIVFGIYLYHKFRSGLFWYCLFFLGLLPVSQIIPLVTRMNDRYLYFPMVGIAGLLCYLCTALKHRIQSPAITNIAASCSVLVVVALSVACHVRGRVWKDTITLFSDMVAKVPNQYITWDGLAEGYRAAGDMDTALQYYEMASKYGYLREVESYHLARIYLEKGDYEKAYSHIWGLLLKGGKFGSKEGVLLLGKYYLLTGSYPDAEKQLQTYLQSFPDSIEGLCAIGDACFMMKKQTLAKEYYLRAMNAGGDSPELYYAAACLEAIAGNVDRSLEYVATALRRGFSNRRSFEQAACLAKVRLDPAFERLLGSDIK